MASALCLSLPSLAQQFSHTHGSKGHHSHDVTTYTVSGTCCCPTHSSVELSGATHHSTQTYVRRYTHPVIERRTYTRVVEPHISHSTHRRIVRVDSHHQHHKQHDHKTVLSHDERRERDYALAGDGHDDRAQAWAHYDRKWRSRTNDKRH
jgi:hypothetical protein